MTTQNDSEQRLQGVIEQRERRQFAEQERDAAKAEMERLTTQLQEARAAMVVAKAALRTPIQGCTLKYYLNEQFPATIGHKPFEDFYRTQMDALALLNKIPTSGSELIKQNEGLREALDNIAEIASTYPTGTEAKTINQIISISEKALENK